MRSFVLLVGIMAMAAIVHADTFEWTDSQGGVHFTDNLDNVPAGYRSKVKKVVVEPVIEKSVEAPVQPPPAADRVSLYGGHDETWWRSSFKSLRDEIKAIQDALPAKRDRLDELRRKLYIFSKPTGRVAYNDMYAEIGNDEARIGALQKQLADLDVEASKAGVPVNWRQ